MLKEGAERDKGKEGRTKQYIMVIKAQILGQGKRGIYTIRATTRDASVRGPRLSPIYGFLVPGFVYSPDLQYN